MALKFVASVLIVYLFCTWYVDAHGKLVDPVNRSSMWREGYNTPINYSDNENFCGGFGTQYEKNGGYCGPCGDDYSKPQPRDNENGGLYGTGIIVQHYRSGQQIVMTVELGKNHMGHFQFSVCPLDSVFDIESEECFSQYPLYLPNGSTWYEVSETEIGNITITAVLPYELSCSHCVLRWHYRCGNNWGFCEDGNDGLGCGPQEIFRSCADIAIW